MLSNHIGNILLRMSILVQFLKVIFLFKERDKCCFAIDKHSVYIETSYSEIVILLLAQKHALSSFCNAMSYMVVKDCLNKNPKECHYLYTLFVSFLITVRPTGLLPSHHTHANPTGASRESLSLC